MFQIQTMTEAHVASVTNRVEKHGEDDKPAVSMMLELTMANTALDLIDPKIRESLYKPVDGQDQLPGVEPATPVLRCNSFERHTLPTAYEGWTLAVDDGIDDTLPMLFGGVKADKFTFEAKQGGSIDLKFRVGTSDVDAEKLGKLAMHNGQSIWITLTAPKPGEAKKTPAEDGASGPSPEDLFSKGGDAGPGDGEPDDNDSEGGETDAGAGETNAAAGETGTASGETGASEGTWPFPKNATTEKPPQSVTVETSRPGTRTARGRDKTKAALAAGQAQQSAATQTMAAASDEAQAHIAAQSKKLEAAEGAAS